MDVKLTKSIQQWLEQPASERDIPLGAGLLLRLDRNRILYLNILRRPVKMAQKLEYELRKHLRIRLEVGTIEEVKRMDKEVTVRAAATVRAADHRGRRADHDSLPDDIRALYDRNGDIYAKLRQCYDTLRQMHQAAPCDRYEYLKILDELDKAYRANWEAYDSYTPPTDNAPSPVDTPQMPTAKEVSAARKFISSNRAKLAAQPDNAALLAAMQQRIDLILASGGDIKPDIRATLTEFGLNFE